ncbi:MAG: hypothetical protein ACI9FJ_002574 [Alteromonadaceae bacterium]|jgi:hypothetical protein
MDNNLLPYKLSKRGESSMTAYLTGVCKDKRNTQTADGISLTDRVDDRIRFEVSGICRGKLFGVKK